MSNELNVKALKAMLQENELDLSMRQLDTVPVKAILQIPRATHLDLSSNLLTTLPREFCSLQQLIKLDLSQNSLVHLPEDFGQLNNLAYLDLYKNRLEELPLSFAQLKQLKWLDLKGNPLEQELAKAAGDCLDEKQCKAAASSVVAYVNQLADRQERLKEKQNKLQEKTSVNEKQSTTNEGAKKTQKRKKPTVVNENEDKKRGDESEEKVAANNHRNVADKEKASRSRIPNESKRGCCGKLFSWLISLVLVVTGLSLICGLLIVWNCSTAARFLPASRDLCTDLHSAYQHGHLPPTLWKNLQKTGRGSIQFVSSKFQRIDWASLWEKTQSAFYMTTTWMLDMFERFSTFCVYLWDLVSDWYQREGHSIVSSLWRNVKLALRMTVAVLVDIADFFMERCTMLFWWTRDTAKNLCEQWPVCSQRFSSS